MEELQVIYETDSFYVILLDEHEKVEAGQNYGVVNKEFFLIDARTESEMAARFICDQFTHSKNSPMAEKKTAAPIKLSTVSKEGLH